MPNLPIERFRSLTEDFMPDALVVSESKVPVDENGNPLRDPYGDPLPAEPVVVVNSKCRLRSQTGEEQVIAGSLQVTSESTIVYPHDVELNESQTVEVAGTPYNIIYIERSTAELKPHSKALVSRV